MVIPTHRWDGLPELEAVRVFVAVAEHRSFRGAANALRVPRSTVSRRVATLESALKTRLLHRTTRHVTLTEAGDAFLERVLPALSTIRDAGSSVLSAQAEPRGVVRITATRAMDELVGETLLDLVARYPDVELVVEFTDRHVDLVAEGYDIAIRAGVLADSSLVARPIGTSQSGYYASPTYLAKRPKPKSTSDLSKHDCIIFTGGSLGSRWRFLGKKKRVEELTVAPRIACNSIRLTRQAAIAGFGIAWLPGNAAVEDVKARRLAPVLRPLWLPPTPLQLVYPSARHLAPQVRVAIELLAERLKRSMTP